MFDIVCGVSGRHIHLCKEHIDELFGSGYQFGKLKETYNPGYVTDENVKVTFESGLSCEMHIVFPSMPITQIEVSTTDCYRFKIDAPKNISGDITGGGYAIITNVVSRKSIFIQNCVIRPIRHIHLDTKQAKELKLINNQWISIVAGSVIFKDVLVRVKDIYKASFHIDTDEGNAAGITDGMIAKIPFNYISHIMDGHAVEEND